MVKSLNLRQPLFFVVQLLCTKWGAQQKRLLCTTVYPFVVQVLCPMIFVVQLLCRKWSQTASVVQLLCRKWRAQQKRLLCTKTHPLCCESVMPNNFVHVGIAIFNGFF